MDTRHLHTRLLLLTGVLLCLAALQSRAQGFIRQYPFFTWDQGGSQSVFPQADGSFHLTAVSYPDFGVDVQLHWLHTDAQGLLQSDSLLYTPYNSSPYYEGLYLLPAGGYVQATSDSNRVVVRRYDAAGAVLWENIQTLNDYYHAQVIVARGNDAGELFVRGAAAPLPNNLPDTGFVFKYTPDGNLLWKGWYDYAVTYVLPNALVPTADGGCVFNNWGYYLSSDTINWEHVLRFDHDGNQVWKYGPLDARLFPHFSGKMFDTDAAGNTLAFFSETKNPMGPNPLRIDKISPAGDMLDTFNLNTLLGVQESLEGSLLFATADGGAVVVVQRYQLNSWTYWVAKIGAAGNLVWKKPLPFLVDAYPAEFSDGQEQPDGSLVLLGHQNNMFLIKLSAEGVIHPHTLIGRVQRDSTFNCQADAFDPPLEGWVVSARSATDSLVYFGSSDAEGNYILSDLDSGAYQIVLRPENYLWQPCADTVALQFSGLTVQTDTLDFQVQSLYDCPLMQVDVATPFLRRCMENTYSIQYCNVGNQPAHGASVTLLLDPLLQVNSSTLPYVQNGAELTFDLGQVAAGACNSFQLVTTTSCDAELGQSLCVEAHIYPDTLCASNLPNWSGAQVEVSAHCEGDSVLFRLHNTGTMPMSEALDFIIVDDHVITRQGLFQLNPGAVLEERVRADGSTWRLIAEQEPGFPLSPDRPTAGVEGCQPLPGGAVSLGMLNQFANYSGNPFRATDCHPVIGSWDPNDKQAFPQGAEQQHFIDQNQSIQYLIRFQNTGTDTAFTVVLRDTLSAWLHAASIRPGAASHPYTWTLSGQGILTVVFADILLPDSNVNEVASHGFIQFNIEQQRDVPLGARIENRAGIYFDFNAPVLTNTVFHTVGKNFLPTSTGGPTPPPSPLEIWPNPSVDRMLVRLGNLYEPGQYLRLRNTLGREVLQVPVQGPQQELVRRGLPAGWYWLELRDARRVRAAGKLIWMD